MCPVDKAINLACKSFLIYMMGEEKGKIGLEEYLALDVEKARHDIVEFVRNEVKNFRKDGALIGLSGGLDSSTVAFLCVEALGKDKVMGLILPERDSSPTNIEDAVGLAKQLGIQYKKIDISPILESLGAYGLLSHEEASDRPAIERAVERIRRLTGKESPFAEQFSSLYSPTAGATAVPLPMANRLHAFATAKTRARMMVLYFNAILNNYLVVGTTDLSEWSIGFYDKYGDGASDISILKHLYKTQIQRLARHIGVPEHIVNKPSSGDLLGMGMPNVVAIGVSYLQLDSILSGIRHGLPDQDVASKAGVRLDTVESIKKAMKAARLMDSMPLSLPMPKWP